MAQKVTATALRAARTALRQADKDTLKQVLESIIHSFEVHGNSDEGELRASILDDLDGYDLLPMQQVRPGQGADD